MDHKFDQFRNNIERKLVDVRAEVKHMADSVQSLGKTIDDLGDEFGDFAAYVSEMYNDHDKRITALEKNIRK